MTAFIDCHRETFGVEPICRRMGFANSTYYAAKHRDLREKGLLSAEEFETQKAKLLSS